MNIKLIGLSPVSPTQTMIKSEPLFTISDNEFLTLKSSPKSDRDQEPSPDQSQSTKSDETTESR